MTNDRIARYLDDLARALRARGAYKVSLLEEVRGHLVDAVEAAERRGLTHADAEDEALTKVGAPDLVASHAAANVPRLTRGALLVACTGTAGSIAFLSLSLLILRPPRMDFRAWTAEAAFVLCLTAVTFVWAKSGEVAWPWARSILLLGSLALVAIASRTFYMDLTRHFDGYGVILSLFFIIQALLTLTHLQLRHRPFSRQP